MERIVLKKGEVLMIETKDSLPDKVASEIRDKFKEIFPDIEVFIPNGAKVTILSAE